MEGFSITLKDGHLHIEGFPDAAKVIKLTGPKARRLSDILLHREDLRFSLECLQKLNEFPTDQRVVRQALWTSAVLHFTKCFGANQARSSLSPKEILKGEPQMAWEVYNWVNNLRNKHIVHDENSWAQAIPAAIVAAPGKDYNIEKIVCLGMYGDTLDQSSWNNLHLLTTKALDWVTEQFDSLCESLTEDLEQEDRDDLLKRDSASHTKPTAEDMAGKRERP